MPSPRLTRDEKRAETRAALVRSAADVFARRGFHAASVDEIAENAGFSVGALYSNFERKEDLLLAAIEQNVSDWTRLFADRFRAADNIHDQARSIADAWIAGVTAEPEPFLLWIELWAYAVRNDRLRADLAQRSRAIRDLFTSMMREAAEQAGVTLPDGLAEELGAVFDALGLGLAVRRLLDPAAVPDGFFGTASSRIVDALLRDLPSSAAS
ncbi:MAG TPA: TetR/AcrR family transcriptional regulator [Solirubrobacteraceae bacterium]|nr:TetR/AcrR family transcriptional regulator [Solirubrobacteraceae bacterium]